MADIPIGIRFDGSFVTAKPLVEPFIGVGTRSDTG